MQRMGSGALAHCHTQTGRYGRLYDKTMGCWEVVDIDTLPEDANLIGVKWVFSAWLPLLPLLMVWGSSVPSPLT